MRLIDADELKQCYTGTNGFDDKAQYVSIRKMIDSRSTAFDVDKVVEQLEKYKRIMKTNWEENGARHDGMATEYYRGIYNAAVDMINIVKGGGIV